MAVIEIKVPDIGDYSDVPVIEVLVAVGDSVVKDQGLVTLESDKATLEVPSSAAGVVKELKVKIGDNLSEGAVVLLLETEGEAAAAPAAPKAETRAAAPAAPAAVFLLAARPGAAMPARRTGTGSTTPASAYQPATAATSRSTRCGRAPPATPAPGPARPGRPDAPDVARVGREFRNDGKGDATWRHSVAGWMRTGRQNCLRPSHRLRPVRHR